MNPTLLALATKDVHANTANPRRDLGNRDSLTASVGALGIIEPLVVTPDPEGGYVIIAGHRRYATAVDLNLETVPCVVRESVDAMTDATQMLHENVIRQDLSRAEEAKGIQQILDLGGDVKAIASALGTTQKVVKTYASASKLAEGTQSALHAGTVTLDQALALAEVEEHEDIYAATVEELATGNNGSWTVRKALDAVAERHAVALVTAYVEQHGCKTTDKNGYENNVRQLRDEAAILEHRDLTCYAVRPTVHPEAGIVHLCINVASHNKDASANTSDAADDEDEARKAARRRVIANNKAWDTANEIRTEWINTFRTRKTAPKGALLPVTLLMIAATPDRDQMRAALRTVDKDLTQWPSITDIGKSVPTQAVALRALMLAVVDDREKAITRQEWRNASVTTVYYLETLAAWGYTLTPPEALYVATVKEGGNPAEVDYPTTTTN